MDDIVATVSPVAAAGPSDEPIAIDFETYYDNDYSLRKMSAVQYVYDPRFHAQLVAIVGRGLKYCGPVEKAPWPALTGAPLLAHNMSFDGQVLQRLQKDGIVPDLHTPRWCDSTDVGCYFQYGRQLKDMAPAVLGVSVSKKVRDMMKGRALDTLTEAEMKDFIDYGASDAINSLGIWNKLVPGWPSIEQWASHRNIQRGFEGIRIDIPKLDRGIELFEEAKVQLLRQMPWVPECPPLSPNAIHAQGRKDGIPTPAKFAAEDPAAMAWEATYSNDFAWVRAVRNFRRVNTFLLKIKALRNAVVDGRFRFSLKYFGAAGTGRFSGGGGFNLQNLPQKPAVVCKSCWTVNLEIINEETGDVLISDDGTIVTSPCPRCGGTDREALDLRGLFLPNEGHQLVVVDFAQVEARMLLWEAGDQRMLDMLKPDPVTGKSMSIYEAHARATMGWTGGKLKDADPLMYKLAKARVLGLGYGLNTPKKFVALAAKSGVEITETAARETIDSFRAMNPLIVKFWRDHDGWIRCSAEQGDATHELRLANGRVIRYFNPRFKAGMTKTGRPCRELVAEVTNGCGNARRWHGAKIAENITQANSRDALVEGEYEVYKAGIPCLFDAHDEAVASVPEDQAKDALETMIELMPVAAKRWAKGCPLEVEGGIVDRYGKL